MSYKLPFISYAYNALEPYFDSETMEIHHTKHHQTYINNTNIILENTKFLNLPVNELISKLNLLPIEKSIALRNNAGGHANHSIFWKILKVGTTVHGNLKKAIEKTFGNFNNFQKDFEKVSLSHFGSGWSWLIKQDDKLIVASTNNQDNPLMDSLKTVGIHGLPIIGLDLWEHAYYLKYQNKRFEYIQAFWNVVNWDEAEKRFSCSIK